MLGGLKKLRSSFSGRIYLEVMILKGINDSRQEVEALAEAVAALEPDRVQLNTVVRPPSEPWAEAAAPDRLEEIRALLGSGTEIAAGFSSAPGSAFNTADRLIETLSRRPLTREDVRRVMGTSVEETDALVNGLCLKGALAQREFNGEIYLSVNGKEDLSDG